MDAQGYVGLRRWALVFAEGDDYRAPEARRVRLHGLADGHPSHEDGTVVTTSAVIDANADRWEVATEGGRTYCLLGAPDPGYASYLKANPALTYGGALGAIVQEAVKALEVQRDPSTNRGSNVTFGCSLETGRGFKAEGEVYALVDGGVDKDSGPLAVEILAVRDHRGRDVTHSLPRSLTDGFEERAVKEVRDRLLGREGEAETRGVPGEEPGHVGLRRWALVFADGENDYRAPEARRVRLHGLVEGHPGYADGTAVTSSGVVDANADRWEVATEGGRTYCLLGAPDPGYASYLKANPSLTYGGALGAIVKEALKAPNRQQKDVRDANVTFDASLETGRGFETDCVVHARCTRGSRPSYSRNYGMQPGDPPEVEILAVIDHRGRDVTDALSKEVVGKFEDQAMDEGLNPRNIPDPPTGDSARRPRFRRGVAR